MDFKQVQLGNASLHFAILEHVVAHGYAPTVDSLSRQFQCSRHETVAALQALQEYHGVVLQPGTSEIWVIHPFSMAPTNFWVESGRGSWWGNCAWCSLGVAALVKGDVTITTTLGAESDQVKVRIVHGRIQNPNLCIHFPIPMMRAWDNVTYTCSTMLLFRGEGEVDTWCSRHNLRKGDVRPIADIWEFAKDWYGNHLNPRWEKWTVREARALFEKHGLTHPVWRVPATEDRF